MIFQYGLEPILTGIAIPSSHQTVEEEVEGGVESQEEMVEMWDAQPHGRDVVALQQVTEVEHLEGQVGVNDSQLNSLQQQKELYFISVFSFFGGGGKFKLPPFTIFN